jgi:hypothetical protein
MMNGITAKISRRLNVLLYDLRSIDIRKEFVPMRMEMLKEAAGFLAEKRLIGQDTDIEALGKEWPELVRTSFNPSDPDAFYSKWTGPAGASNIIANITDQFKRYYMFGAMSRSIGRNNGFDGTILDFGCGTGALSMAWQRRYCRKSKLLLADVDNLAAEFVRYQALKHRECRIEQRDISLSELPDLSVDVLICAHVLEHLKNPSEVFGLIEGRIKNGGFLILDAPWGGHPEHLPEAPVNWEKNGGALLLREKYEKTGGLNPYPGLSGIFRKK